MWWISAHIQAKVLLDPSRNNRKGCDIVRSIEGPLPSQIKTFICGTSRINLFQALVSIPLPESKLASLEVEQIQKGTLRSTQIEFEFIRGMYKFTHSQLFRFNIFEAN